MVLVVTPKCSKTWKQLVVELTSVCLGSVAQTENVSVSQKLHIYDMFLWSSCMSLFLTG
jgi:hypothetical protein